MATKNLGVTINNIDGTPMDNGGGKPVTVQSIIMSALLAQFPDETNLSGDEKFTRFKLAMRLDKESEQDLTPEDSTLIKRLVGKGFGPLVVGQVYELLNA